MTVAWRKREEGRGGRQKASPTRPRGRVQRVHVVNRKKETRVCAYTRRLARAIHRVPLLLPFVDFSRERAPFREKRILAFTLIFFSFFSFFFFGSSRDTFLDSIWILFNINHVTV